MADRTGHDGRGRVRRRRRAVGGELARVVENDSVSSAEIRGLVLLAYVVGSTLLVAASAFNPIGPGLILLSGVSSGFAAMAGLTAIPRLVENRVGRRGQAQARSLSIRDGSPQGLW